MPQFIYTMKVSQGSSARYAAYSEDIYLSFYFGAKIGVLRRQRAGKSSLLRIMAGEDTHFLAKRLPPTASPRLPSAGASARSAKRCRGNVEEGVAAIKPLLARYDEVNAKLGEDLSAEEMDKVLGRAVADSRQDRCLQCVDLDSRLELAMDALRLPPPDADVITLSGASAAAWRSAACCCNRPICCCRRADQPLDAESVAWLERFLKDYAGTVVRRDPRPILSR